MRYFLVMGILMLPAVGWLWWPPSRNPAAPENEGEDQAFKDW